jgi:predicted CoA-binding protein
MNEPELLRSAVHKTTSAIMTQKHAREIVQELHAAGYHISPVLFDPENEHLRSLLDEAIAALEKIDKFEISGLDSMVNQVFRLKNIARNALGRIR